MNESFAIDLDQERVALDGAWYTREDLARKIKEMVDAGDFRVARQSAALEALVQALASLATVTLRLPAPTHAALSGAANRQGRTLESLARELLERAIAAPQTGGVVESRPVPVAQPPVVAPVPLTAVVPGGPPSEPPSDANPIQLTPKRPAAPLTDAESGWFKPR